MINHETKYWYLKNHKLFSNLNPQEVKEICLISNFKTAQKGEAIFFNHDDIQRVYTVKRGTIKIIENDADGNEIIKDILQSGDLFGQFTLDSAESNEYAVAVSERVTCCSFTVADFEYILAHNPSLALHYTKLIGFRLKRLENRYANLMFKDVRTRFRLFLADWASKEGQAQEGKILLTNYLTHQDIASLICATRQTVTQLFSEYKQQGVLDYTRNTIEIIKPLG